MTNDFTVTNKQVGSTATASESSSASNNRLPAVLSGTVQSSDTIGNNSASLEESKKQQNQNKQKAIEYAIKDIIKGTELSLSEAKKILEPLLNSNNTTTIDTSAYTKVLTCLKYAIEDCTLNGKLDKEKLGKIFNCYVFLTVKSNKKNVDCDKARAGMKMSLVQFIKAKNPALKNKKDITSDDIANTIKIFLSEQLTQDKINKIKKSPKEAKEVVRTLFNAALANCTPEEIALLTDAFVKLLKDNGLKDEIHIIVEEVCNSLKDNPQQLSEFLNTTLVTILKKYNFDDKTIQKICNSSLSKLFAENPKVFEKFLDSGIAFLESLADSADLPILLEILEMQINDGNLDNLNDVQKNVLKKYKNQLDILIQIYAQIVQKPELAERFKEKLNKLNGLCEKLGLNNYIFDYLQNQYKQNPDIFENISEEEFAQRLNKFTNSEQAGNSNSGNLNKSEESRSESSGNDIGFGFTQNSTGNISDGSYVNFKLQELYNKSDDNKANLYVVESNNTTKSKSSNINEKRIVNWSVVTNDDIRQHLGEDIHFGDVLDNYENLPASTQLFVDDMISAMSMGMKTYFLNGIKGKNHVIIQIVKRISVDPQKLKLSLDYASEKELERIEEQKSKNTKKSA